MHCPVCGTKVIPDEARFCFHCGQNLSAILEKQRPETNAPKPEFTIRDSNKAVIEGSVATGGGDFAGRDLHAGKSVVLHLPQPGVYQIMLSVTFIALMAVLSLEYIGIRNPAFPYTASHLWSQMRKRLEEISPKRIPTITAVPVSTATPAPAFTLTPTRTPAQLLPCTPHPLIGWVAYAVRPGDTLSQIARRANISVAELQRANCLTSAVIIAGEMIYAPQMTDLPTPTVTSLSVLPPAATPEPAAVGIATEQPVLPSATPLPKAAAAPPSSTPMPPTPTQLSPAPTTASCGMAVDPDLKAYWSDDIGCPAAPSHISWASFTPFERGFMLWRDDTGQIYGFFNEDKSWRQAEDRFVEGMPDRPVPNRGEPPAGLKAPIRGTGLVWEKEDIFFRKLGWARLQQKGFCAEIQIFTEGFLIRESGLDACLDNKSGKNQPSRAKEADFEFRAVKAYNAGRWSP